jgi:hypothetical protein
MRTGVFEENSKIFMALFETCRRRLFDSAASGVRAPPSTLLRFGLSPRKRGTANPSTSQSLDPNPEASPPSFADSSSATSMALLQLIQVLSPVVGDRFDPLIARHQRSVGALDAGPVEVGGVVDGSMEAGVSLADLDHELVEGLAFVEDPAYLVDGVPVRRDREDRAAYPD